MTTQTKAKNAKSEKTSVESETVNPVTDESTDWSKIKVEQFANFTDGDVNRAILAQNAGKLTAEQGIALADRIVANAKNMAKTVRKVAKTENTKERDEAIERLAIETFFEVEEIYGRGAKSISIRVTRNEAGELTPKIRIVSPTKNPLPKVTQSSNGTFGDQMADSDESTNGEA